LLVIAWCIIGEPISRSELSMRRGLSVPNSVLAPQSGVIDDWGFFIIPSRWAERDDITGLDRSERGWLDHSLIPRPQRAQHASVVIGRHSIRCG
jgi:hypothetical protein